jgi:amino acid transporter
MEETSVFEKFELQLDQTAKDFLKETAKWAYFLAILGFIGIVLIVVIAIFAGVIFSTLGNTVPGMAVYGGSFGTIISVVYFLLAAVYFFPVYYLFKFASNGKKAFKDNDTEALTASLGYLKSHYKFVGIMMLSILVLYGLMIVFVVLGGLFSK